MSSRLEKLKKRTRGAGLRQVQADITFGTPKRIQTPKKPLKQTPKISNNFQNVTSQLPELPELPEVSNNKSQASSRHSQNVQNVQVQSSTRKTPKHALNSSSVKHNNSTRRKLTSSNISKKSKIIPNINNSSIKKLKTTKLKGKKVYSPTQSQSQSVNKTKSITRSSITQANGKEKAKELKLPKPNKTITTPISNISTNPSSRTRTRTISPNQSDKSTTKSNNTKSSGTKSSDRKRRVSKKSTSILKSLSNDNENELQINENEKETENEDEEPRLRPRRSARKTRRGLISRKVPVLEVVPEEPSESESFSSDSESFSSDSESNSEIASTSTLKPKPKSKSKSKSKSTSNSASNSKSNKRKFDLDFDFDNFQIPPKKQKASHISVNILRIPALNNGSSSKLTSLDLILQILSEYITFILEDLKTNNQKNKQILIQSLLKFKDYLLTHWIQLIDYNITIIELKNKIKNINNLKFKKRNELFQLRLKQNDVNSKIEIIRNNFKNFKKSHNELNEIDEFLYNLKNSIDNNDNNLKEIENDKNDDENDKKFTLNNVRKQLIDISKEIDTDWGTLEQLKDFNSKLTNLDMILTPP